jgi:DNA-binding NtrC family response regulator
MQEETLTSGFPFPMPKVSAEQLPTLAEWNSRYIDYVLNFTKGKKTAAARILGINRRTLYRRNKAKNKQTNNVENMPVTAENMTGAVLHEPALGEH